VRTRIGGAGSYGVAGNVMDTGIWNVWYGINTFLALALVGIFFAVPYRRLGLTTVGQLFAQRYGRGRGGWLTSLCVQTEYLVVNVIEPLLIGVIVSAIVGIELVFGIFIGAFVIIAATASSGLKGTSTTNVIHCVVIIFGLALVGIVVSQQMGGWSSVVNQANMALDDAGVSRNQWWSFIGLGWFPIIAMFFSATIHTPAASVYVNYASSAKRENILVPAFLLAGGIAALMPFLSAIIGIEALAKYGADAGIGGYNSITQIALDAGPLIGGIALAAVLAALISSGGPILLASSTMFVNDWIPAAKNYSADKKLKAYRVTSVIYGLVAAGIACYFGYVVGTASVLDWLLLGFAMVVPPAIAITYIFYVPATTEDGVYWGIASGYGLGLAAWIINNLFFELDVDVASYFTTLTPLLVLPNLSLWRQSWRNDSLGAARNKLLMATAVVAAFGLAGFVAVADTVQWARIALGLLAPVVIGLIYTFVTQAVTDKGLLWGIALTYLGAFFAWLLNTYYIGTELPLVLITTVGLSLWLIPTAALATQSHLELDERAQEFYRKLRTPA